MGRVLHTLLHPESGWSFITIGLCWILIAYLTGAIVGALFSLFLLVLLLATVKALLTKHDRKHFIRDSVNEALHTSTYAITISMLSFMILPRLLLESTVLSVYQMQLIIAAPTLFLFTFVVHFSHHKILDGRVSPVSSAAVAAIKTVVLVAVLMGAIAYGTAQAADRIQTSQVLTLAGTVQQVPRASTLPDLQVSQELLEHWQAEYIKAEQGILEDCTLCSPSRLLVDTARIVESSASIQFTAQLVDQLASQQGLLSQLPESVKQEQLSTMRRDLIDRVDQFTAPEPILTPDTTPKQLYQRFSQNISLPSQAEQGLTLVFGESPLHESMDILVKRTLLWQRGIAVIDRAVTKRVIAYPPVIEKLYEGRGVEESLDSKLVRYRILTGWAQGMDAQDII